MDTSELLWTALPVVGALAGLVVVMALFVFQKGPRRAALAPTAIALALVAPTLGVAGASKLLIEMFSGMALTGSGGRDAVTTACRTAEQVMHAGSLSAGVILLFSAPLLWLGRGRSDVAPAASGSRLVVLALLALAPALLVVGFYEHARRTNRTVVEVVSAPEETSEPSTAVSERPSRIGIAEVSQRLATGTVVGFVGAGVVIVVLIGLAAVSAILAWRVTAPTLFAAYGSLLMLLLSALALASLFLFERRVPFP